MIELILLTALTIALLCNGLIIITGENMIFEFVKNWLDKIFMYTVVESVLPNGEKLYTKKARKIYYPILYCPRCMPSIWGTLTIAIFITAGIIPLNWHLAYIYPLTLLCAVTMSTILSEMYE